MILKSFVITFLVNVSGDILLIPFFKNEGAAFAFLAACMVQTIYFLKQNEISELKRVWYPLIPCTLCAVFSGFLSRAIFPGNWLVFPAAIILYLLLLSVSMQLKLSDSKNVKLLFN